MLLTALLFGAYMSRRINFSLNDDGISAASIDHAQIWTDLVAMLALIGIVCGKAVEIGNAARSYFDGELQPWLGRHNINVSLPAIDLPRLPGTRSEVA